MKHPPVLAVIPARGGSKGLPGKNVRPLAGMPLIGHAIALAAELPELLRTVVSTDSEEIASVARAHGGDVPFLRPAELARDDTPMWPVLRHALHETEAVDGTRYEALLLLDPTAVGRLPSDVTAMHDMLVKMPDADGVIAVCRPGINPLWNSWKVQEGWVTPVFSESDRYTHRQEVPEVYRVNAALYLWRAEYVRRKEGHTWRGGKMLPYEMPEHRSMHIDDVHEFERAEALIAAGFFGFPWLPERGSS